MTSRIPRGGWGSSMVRSGSRGTAGAEGSGLVARLAPAAAVAVATALAFLPTFRNGLVDFDDQTNLVENPYFRGFTPENLAWMWTNLDGHYLPLTWLSFAFDHALWGMDPRGFHGTNLALHIANAVGFYVLTVMLLRLATRRAAGEEPAAMFVAAGVAAALFALHPLRVESVAWATERRDVLSGLFFMLTLITYLRARDHGKTDAPRRRVPIAALVAYALSLLAKPAAMGLPVVLAVLDVYPLRRLPARPREWLRPSVRGVWLEKVPFVVLAVAAAISAGMAQSHADTFYSLEAHGVGGRIGQAFYGLAFYLWKTVAPVSLSPLYQLPVGWSLARADVVAAVVLVGVTTVALVLLRRRWPAGLAVWVSYVALVAPVLGLAHVGPQIAADRYTYLATLGWAVLVGGLVFATAETESSGRIARGWFAAAVAGAVVVALTLGALTWRQVGVWRDSITLWQTAVRADPRCYICENNLGNALVRSGRANEAATHFEAAMRIQPDDADAYANLGVAAMEAKRDDDARRYLERALRIDPTHASAHTNVARMLIDARRSEEAIPHLEAALRKDPMLAEARINLGLALLERDDLDGAERELRQALRILPDSAVASNNLGILLMRRAAFADAAAEFRRASVLDPTFPEPRFNLALALDSLDLPDEAVAALREALRLRPAYAAAHEKLGHLLLQGGDGAGALAHLAEAARLAPAGDAATTVALLYVEQGRAREAIEALRAAAASAGENADATNLLAWLLATTNDDALRDGREAVLLAERAVAAAGATPDADRLDTLAAAFAESGRFAEALEIARRAQTAAEASGNHDLAREIQARIAWYEAGRPFRTE